MAINELLRDKDITWLKSGGTDSDVVIASRIRLARNLRGEPFPPVEVVPAYIRGETF